MRTPSRVCCARTRCFTNRQAAPLPQMQRSASITEARTLCKLAPACTTSARANYTGSCLTKLPFTIGSTGTATTSAAQGVADGRPAEGTAAPQEALQEALKHLDMAALMGGPALRPALDAAIARVQRGMQAAAAKVRSEAAMQRAADYAQRSGPNEVSCSTEAQLREPPGKRQRTEGVDGANQPPDNGVRRQSSPLEPCGEGEPVPRPRQRVERGVAGEQRSVDAAINPVSQLSEDTWPSGSLFMAAPPPGSLHGEPIPAVELPSLERCAVW